MSQIESRKRQWLRWGLTGAAAGMLVLWLGSAYFSITRVDNDQKYMTLGHGTLHIMWTDSPLELITTWRVGTQEWFVETAPPLPVLQLGEGPDGMRPQMRTAPGLTLKPDWQMIIGWWWFDIPLWIPSLLLAAPATAMWRRRMVRARRLSSGRCVACGYQFAAESVRCSECGLQTEHAGR